MDLLILISRIPAAFFFGRWWEKLYLDRSTLARVRERRKVGRYSFGWFVAEMDNNKDMQVVV